MEFITTDYRFDHGAEPRGRGSWAFSPRRHPAADDKTIFWSPAEATFAEAKKAARAHFKGTGIAFLWVLA